jgi:hypothetical protein
MLGAPLGVALAALVPIAFLAANREAFRRTGCVVRSEAVTAMP